MVKGSWGSWKFSYNLHAFESPLSALAEYWFGFLVADGCISRGALRLSLSGVDAGHLYVLKDFLGGGGIRDYQGNPHFATLGRFVNKQPFTYLSVCNRKIVSDLVGLGLTERKSLTATLPSSLANSPNVWRGIFDGDGSVNCKTRQMILSSSSHTLVDQYEQFLDANTIRHKKHAVNTSKNPHWQVHVTYDVDKLAHLLYDRADQPTIERKRLSAMRFVKESSNVLQV